MKKRSGSKIKVYREWNDKKPFKATLGKKISNKGKHGNYDDVYMATIDGEDKEIKVAYGELSKMEPPRDVWFMMNSSELNEVFEWWHPLVSLGGAIAIFSLPILINAPGQILNPGSIASGNSWGDVFRHYKKKFKDKKAAKNLTKEDVLELINLIQTNMEKSDTGSGVKRYMKGLMNKLEKEMSKEEEELDKDELLRLFRDVQNYSERIKVNQSSNTTSMNEVKIKNQIKEEIIRILSEGMTADEWADAQEEKRLDKHPEKNIIKKVQDLISQEKEKKEITRPLSEKEIDAIYDNFIDTNKYKETVIDDPDGTKENATLKIDTPDGKSYKVLTSAEDDEKWWKLKYIREEEMTDAEMEKKAEKEAKSKEAEKISDVKDDLAKQQKMLKKLKDVMKDRAKDYKKAEGKEKDNIKTELKTLTLAKKKIEAKIKKLDKQL